MDVERESPDGCQNNFNSEENNESDFDYGPSKLGTKEFWEASYKKELETFKDIGDVGEIWFGEESMKRVLRWMDKAKIPENAAILDIGTGNGAFLLEMAKHGYRNLTGVDYSASSVELAKNVLQAEDLTDVTVKEMDFLNCDGKLKGFDVCIDKGTFDAIILNPDNFNDGKKLYIQSLKEALKCDGFFAITSCNWTREQLLDRFSEGFEFVQELPTPRFQFGGKTGNAVTALIFKRVH
ncbi:EEF1A lysine methyltransferase 2 [Takifugu rubripes]|uniref:EEF1A lysine methyltransferase 2 n=1 Tax=Takifugu rubripes TaxID=31033 RepID=UPI0002989858|nr:EEF1A lysine methyltransferase 2 [Takifugu rubripes]|eukprot:XP_003964018.1 PREDICTED: methyltransferase-like protein 10 [Takifugu rubripes]